MDKKTAELLLNIKEFDSPLDAYEQQLFRIRRDLMIYPVIPSVFYKKREKLCKLSKSYAHFGEMMETVEVYELMPLTGENLLEKFICYEQNKSLIKQLLSNFLNASNIEQGILQLIDNLDLWAQELKDLKLDHIEIETVSKELDRMTMYALFKDVDKIESSSYLEYDMRLLKEFRRIQILSETIKN